MTGPVARASRACRDLRCARSWVIAPLIVVIVVLGFYPEAAARRHQPRGRAHAAARSAPHDPAPDPCRPAAERPQVSAASDRRSRRDVHRAVDRLRARCSPMLIVFGAASSACSSRRSCRGRCAWPRAARGRRSAGWSPRSSRSPSLARHADSRRSPPRARSRSTARRCSCRARSLLLGDRQRAARRRPVASAPAAARSPRRPSTCRARPRSAPRRRAGLEQTEVFPLLMFAVGGMMLFPAANDLLTMFVALEVLVAAALPAVRARPPSPAAVAGGRGQVLPARRVLVGVLPLRRGAALRLRRQHLASPPSPTAPLVRPARRHAAAPRHRAARGRPAVQDRRRAVPLVDPGRLPGRADPDHRVHGGLHEGRRVRRAAAACFYVAFGGARLGLAAGHVGASRSSRWSSARSSRSPRPT